MMTTQNPPRRRPAGQGLSRHTAPAAAVFLAGSQLALAQPLTERVEHAVEIPRNARVSIMNFAGHVEVHGTDPGEDSTLRVIGVKRLEAELPAEEAERIFERVNLDLRRRGRRIHIGPNRPRGDRGRPSGDRRESPPITEVRPPRRVPPVSVDLEVWLPDGASLEVRTFTAPITITGIRAPDGDFLLRSVSGPIEIRDLGGRRPPGGDGQREPDPRRCPGPSRQLHDPDGADPGDRRPAARRLVRVPDALGGGPARTRVPRRIHGRGDNLFG